jgi:hypothetical protein
MVRSNNASAKAFPLRMMYSPTPTISLSMKRRVSFDGPITKEQAGAQKAFREHAMKSLPRYFEVEAALKEQPKNSALRREFKALKKCFEFLKNDAQRNFRREALRLALETKPVEPNTEHADAEPNRAHPGSGHEDAPNPGSAEPNTPTPGSEHGNQAE